MNYIDANIPIQCPECPGQYWEEGVENMLKHLGESHSDLYSFAEAKEAVRRWTDDAYIRAEEILTNYYEERKIDKAIEADLEWKMHKI